MKKCFKIWRSSNSFLIHPNLNSLGYIQSTENMVLYSNTFIHFLYETVLVH